MTGKYVNFWSMAFTFSDKTVTKWIMGIVTLNPPLTLIIRMKSWEAFFSVGVPDSYEYSDPSELFVRSFVRSFAWFWLHSSTSGSYTASRTALCGEELRFCSSEWTTESLDVFRTELNWE